MGEGDFTLVVVTAQAVETAPEQPPSRSATKSARWAAAAPLAPARFSPVGSRGCLRGLQNAVPFAGVNRCGEMSMTSSLLEADAPRAGWAETEARMWAIGW